MKDSLIVLDCRSIQDRFPGIGRYSYQLARSMAENFASLGFRILIDPGARNTRFRLDQLAAFPNTELVRVGAAFFSPEEQALAWESRTVKGAAAWHSPYYALPYALRLPTIVTLPDVTPLVFPAEMPNPFKRLTYRMLNRLAAHKARGILTFSAAARADLEGVLGVPRARVSVVPLAPDPAFRPASAVNIERVRAAYDLPPDYVLYIGSNKPHKNLPRLVEAWAQVINDAVLVVAGAWDVRYPQSRAVCARLGLEKRVLFRPNVTESDLSGLIGGARAFVFPSVHEGFGLPPLEAMACGTPVACANASSLPEVVGDAALLFNPFDVNDMALGLTRILTEEPLRLSLCERGLQRAQQFSWDRVARETMGVYRRATDDGRRTTNQ